MSINDEIRVLGGDFETILGLQGKSRDEMNGDTVLGAVAERVRANPNFQAALMQHLAKTQPILQTNPPTKKRRQPIGLTYSFTQTGTVNVSVQPQCLFRGEKLIVSETYSPSGASAANTTVINAIFVGNKSQFPTLQSSVPSSAFAAGVLDNEMLLDTCQPAIFIQFQVTCSSGSPSSSTPIVWTATIFGHAVM